MINKSELPENWKVVKIDDICDVVRGGSPRPAGDPKYYDGNIPFLKVADLTKDSNVYLKDFKYTIKEAGLHKTRRIQPNTLLLTNSGATLGVPKICMIDATFNDGIAAFLNLEPKTNLYLYYFWLTKTKSLRNINQGAAQPNLNTDIIKNVEIPLPPLAEQERIVAKIEELFSELDAGRTSLETAARQLKTYRQAVLKWAFEEHKEDYKFHLLKDISEKIQIGPFGSQLHREDYIENGIPLINPMHIKDGQIVPDQSYTITVEKRDSLPNYILETGDVVMGRRGEMGRCGLVNQKENGWFCGTGSLFVRPKEEKVYPKFLYNYLRSDPVKKYLEENAGGTTMANLNLKIVSGVPVFLPTLEEQQRIVEEIESRLSVCDKLEETIAGALAQSESLRQSILKQAFAGKLVPQDAGEKIELAKGEKQQTLFV